MGAINNLLSAIIVFSSIIVVERQLFANNTTAPLVVVSVPNAKCTEDALVVKMRVILKFINIGNNLKNSFNSGTGPVIIK